MVELSRFWDGNSILGVGVGDIGPYDADKMAEAMAAFGGDLNGAFVGLEVTESAPQAKSVTVGEGKGMAQGYIFVNGADEVLTIDANTSGQDRIDLITFRCDWTLQTIRLTVIKGTPAGVPVPPALIQVDGVVWDVELAQIEVVNGFVTIVDARITDERLMILDGTFLDLGDTPAIYTGSAGKVATVNVGETGLVFSPGGGAASFTDLDDVPVSYLGEGGKVAAVNVAETDLEFIVVDEEFTALTDTPANYTGDALKVLRVNAAETDVEFVELPSDEYTADEGSDYTTSSATFADIDGTNWKFDITTTGGNVLVHFHGNLAISGAVGGGLDIKFNGARYAGDDGIIAVTPGGAIIPVSFTVLVTGLAAGTYTFSVQWASFNGSSTLTLYAGAGTADKDVHPQFWVMEV